MNPTAPHTNPLRWGILGTGNIARQFASAMKTSTRGVITAVGSRSPDSAAGFVSAYAPNAAAVGYQQLISHPDVDAVYVSLPNSMHAQWTIASLNSGKHVLCEKPLAMNLAEAQSMFAAAEKAGKLLVEAFMYVSHPLTKSYLAAIRDGRIGKVKHIRTSFCYRTNKIAGNVRFDAGLGGGALMDIGCYCLSLTRLITGQSQPAALHAQAIPHPTGVDEQVSALLRFNTPTGPITSAFTCGMALQADNTATISGEDGYIEIPIPWKPPVENARWILARSTPPKMDQGKPGAVPPPPPPPREEFTINAGKDLYALEADDFAAAVAGEIPPAVTKEDSLANQSLIDQIAALIRH